ncbi:MAG: hypothetical protein KDA58_06280 [Planctomycetaceae bacterium]|nr:hypothetical protein [Planctomycetaceae bacterium]
MTPGPLHVGEVLLRWEGMRIVYNLILVGLAAGGAGILHEESLRDPAFLWGMLELLILLNVLFCGLPLLEIGARLAGWATAWFAVTIFLIGLCCSAFLLLAKLFVYEFQHQLPTQ